MASQRQAKTVSEGRLDVYLIAMGGTGMAPLACLLQEEGHRVRGSDAPLYPPMSTLLESRGIEPHVGYDPAHLEPPPDLVIVGNAVPRTNSEVLEAERRGLQRLSMPEALWRFFLQHRRPLVVAGTHGKTSTTAMAAWVYRACGADPGYLIGGVPLDLPTGFYRGRGERFIVEGDEYNAAYFDRGPKFLHYRPETLIFTGVEYDHADLYPTPAALSEAFGALLESLPPTAAVVACGDSEQVRSLVRRSRAEALFYGLREDNDVRPRSLELEPQGCRFRLADPEAGEVEVRLRLTGDHSVSNALAVWAAARRDCLPAARVAQALSAFRGVKRRLEIVATEGGIIVVDDFAHHPTAVEKSLRALRQRFPDRRLIALFEPRSLTAGRSFFFDAYSSALGLADRVFLAPVYHRQRLPPEVLLDLPALAATLTDRGVPACACEGVDEVLRAVLAELQQGDVVVAMSSGDFQRLPQRLAASIASGLCCA